MRLWAALFLHFSSSDSAKAFFFKRMEERCMLGNDEEQGHLGDIEKVQKSEVRNFWTVLSS